MAKVYSSVGLSLKKRATGMLVMLAIEFVLGMLVNLFGHSPAEPEFATQPFVFKLFFPLHALIGFGFLIGATMLLVKLSKTSFNEAKKIAKFGFVSIVVTVASGIATVLVNEEKSEWTSLVMSLGFLLSFYLYGKLYYFLSK